MTKSFLLSLSILLSYSTYAQELTVQQVEVYANQLVKKEILNEKGKAALIKAARAKKPAEEEDELMRSTMPYDSSGFSKEWVLAFCYKAFSNSYMHRILTPGIEKKIIREDSMINAGWVAYPPIKARDFKDYVHPKRSTIGYTRTRTLEDFKALGLINELVYQDCKKALQDSSVSDEVSLIELMTQRSVFYRCYDESTSKNTQCHSGKPQ